VSEVDSRDFRNACGHFVTGVTVITTRCAGEGEHGMTANAFMSISLAPPLIAVSIADTAKMLKHVRKAGRFAVSILSRSMEPLAWHFSGRSNQGIREVFEDCDGLPVIRDALAVFTADVVEEIPAGDHTIFVGRVSCLVQRPGREPLVFDRGRFALLEWHGAGKIQHPRRAQLP
jgi:flavin reductase (DIM6/NTAB) family NADH-FMN oxidoreductase RutF